MTDRVLVTGVGGPAGRSLVDQLLERGFEVTGVDMEPADVPGAMFAKVPAAADPTFLDALRRIARESRADLIIPTVTEELIVLARARNRVAEIPVAVASGPSVALANDKWFTYRTLSARELSVPASALASEIGSASQLQAAIGLPCLTKPRVSRGGRGVTLHTSIDDYALDAHDENTLVQEFAPGTEYAPNLYLTQDGRADVVVVLEKTALAHGLVGNALAVRRTDDDDVAALACAAARALGITGPVDVDIRRRSDGVPIVLEINARFGANSAHAPEVLDALLADRFAIGRAA
jgi:carbamoylphosphate synthase large subunit